MTVQLEVAGMHCSSCSSLIEEVVLEVAGVSAARFDLERAGGEVRLDPSVVTAEELCDVIGELGYRATSAGADRT